MKETNVLQAYKFEKHFRITYDGNATIWLKDSPEGEEYCNEPLKLSEGKHGNATLFAPFGSMLYTQEGWKEVSNIQEGDILINSKSKSS